MKNSLKLAVVASAVVLSGSLQAGTLSGNYMATCSGCAISFDSKMNPQAVSCNCSDSKGNIVQTSIDVSSKSFDFVKQGMLDVLTGLNDRFSNCNGNLVDAPACPSTK